MRCAGRVSDKISANKQDRQNKAQQTYKQPHVPLYPLQMDGKAYVELREDGDTSSAASYRRLSPVAKKLIYFSLAVLFLAGVVIVIVVYAVHTTKAPAPLVSDLNVQGERDSVVCGVWCVVCGVWCVVCYCVSEFVVFMFVGVLFLIDIA